MTDEPSWLNDFFGPMRHRPDHPDLPKLSEVLLRMDGRVGPHQSDEANEAEWQRTIAEIGIDPEVLSYSATQRAMRMSGVETNMELLAKAEQVMTLSSAWIDGFTAGALFLAKITEDECPFDCDSCRGD